jgi:hypothetical protein
MSNELSTVEANTLRACELVIEKGIQTFFEVGDALMEIRTKRLYRKEFITFRDYCEIRWGMSDRHANRLMESAEVVSNLRPIGLIPTHESQVRPLTNLEPERQREAWKEATKGNSNPTAAQVAKAREIVNHSEPKTYSTDVPVREPKTRRRKREPVKPEPTIDDLCYALKEFLMDVLRPEFAENFDPPAQANYCIDCYFEEFAPEEMDYFRPFIPLIEIFIQQLSARLPKEKTRPDVNSVEP